MYRQNYIQAAVIFLFFAVMMVTGIQFRGVAKIMPMFVSGLGMFCTAAFFLHILILQKKNLTVTEIKPYPKKDTIELIHAFLLITAYCLLLKPAGFLVSSILFFFLFAWRFGNRKKSLSYLLGAIIVTMVIYFAFTLTLHTNFPPGILKGII